MNHESPHFSLDAISEPDTDSTTQLYLGLTHFNQQQAGTFPQQAFARYVRDPQNQVIGGIYGQISWDWLHIELLWLDASLRGRGLGRELLTSIERHALALGIHRFMTNTTSFQAVDFYQAHGYRIFGEVADLPPGHTNYYLRKVLPTPDVTPA